MVKRQQIAFHAPSNGENHFNRVLPVSLDIHRRSSFGPGPVGPLTSRPVDDPGLEETGRRESRGERRTAREKEPGRRGKDREMREGARKGKRDGRERGRALVGGREMKWGLLWFRRWPVVTSSSDRLLGPKTRDGAIASERERSLFSRETGFILPADCGGCCTSETLHLASSEGTVWARRLLAIRPCAF